MGESPTGGIMARAGPGRNERNQRTVKGADGLLAAEFEGTWTLAPPALLQPCSAPAPQEIVCFFF